MKISQKNEYIEYENLDSLRKIFGYFEDEDGVYHTFLRGESRYHPKLSASYFRNGETSIKACEIFGLLYKKERNPYREALFGCFLRDTIYPSEAPIELIYLIGLQHEGISTPLLDLSVDIYAPLYFACKDHNTKSDMEDGLIYKLDDFNDDSDIKCNIFNANKIITKDDRARKQQSAFALTHSYSEEDGLVFYDICNSNCSVTGWKIHGEDKIKILEDVKKELKTEDLDSYFGLNKGLLSRIYGKLLSPNR